jgi:hypothetical protein
MIEGQNTKIVKAGNFLGSKYAAKSSDFPILAFILPHFDLFLVTNYF